MKKLILLLGIVSNLALAGHDTGGGGIGLKVGNNIYLYDFVESGIEYNVYVGEEINDEMKVAPIVRASLLIPARVQKLVVTKLNEVYKISPTFALSLTETLQNYQWRFVKPSLISTRDLGRTPINVTLEQKQIAFRDDQQKTVTIDAETLAKMPELHQVGLYFHEMIYALSGQYDSYTSRLLNSYLFHPSFIYSTFEQLQDRVELTYGVSVPLLSYEEFAATNSEDFKTECAAFSTEVSNFNKESLSFLDQIYKEIKIAKINGNRGEWETYFSSVDRQIRFGNTIYTVLGKDVKEDANYYPAIIVKRRYTMILRNDKTATAYSMPQKNQDRIKLIQSQSFGFIEKNKDSFYDKCLATDIQEPLDDYLSHVHVKY